MDFGKRLKEQREIKKLSQQQVEQALNIGRGLLSKWETNIHRPDYEMLIELAKFFDVSTDYLLGLKNY